MTAGPVGILLAAGRSKRFGTNKLLYPLHDGTPMAVACARPLCAVLPEVIAVVEDIHQEVATLLRAEGVHVIANPRACQGMGTSIACSVAASVAARGWIVALADMPFLSEAVIRTVLTGLERGADIVAPVYQGKRGHPVGFSNRHAESLMQLDTDAGARAILAANRESLELIEVQEQGVIIDIDEPLTRLILQGPFIPPA